MKLKYYLRGLAVGVILTTIILSIANSGNKPLTDTEIRKRALELGMVEGGSVKLTDMVESNEESNESYNTSIAVESKEESGSEGKTADSASTTGLEVSSENESESASQTTSTEASDGAETPSEPPASITITIKSGDSSYTVSKALASAGLVEDAVEFDNYLCDNGYSRTIRTGTYEITSDMTYEEIAKKIAR